MVPSPPECLTNLVSRSVAIAEKLLPAKLLVRPRPDKGESLLGYIHRVGELNGLTSLRWISSMLSEVGALGIPDHKLRMLAESVGIDQEDLSILTSRPKATQMANILLFMGAYVPAALFRRKRSAICVECLRGRAATPAIWDFRLICACVRHRRWLIDRCPKCDRALNWHRELLLRCRCGNDLTLRIRDDHEPPEAVMDFTKALEGELSGELPFAEDPTAKFPVFMAGRLVADSIKSFQRTRDYVRFRCDHEKMQVPRSTRTHSLDMATILTMSEVLIDWPASLYAEMHRFEKATRMENCKFSLIGNSEISSIVNSIYRILLRFKAIIGEDCVESAYQGFCDKNSVIIYDHKSILKPRFIRAVPKRSDNLVELVAD